MNATGFTGSGHTGLAAALCILRDRQDEATWTVVHGLVRRPLHLRCWAITGDLALADDAMQEALVGLTRSVAAFAPAPGDADAAALGYVLRIGERCAWRLRRRRDRLARRERGSVWEDADADLHATAAPVASDLEEAMAGLHGRYRRVLELRFLRGLDYSEVSATLGLHPALARKRVERGLRLLRRWFAIHVGLLFPLLVARLLVDTRRRLPTLARLPSGVIAATAIAVAAVTIPILMLAVPEPQQPAVRPAAVPHQVAEAHLIDVTAAPYGARGDGIHDDRDAIQAAIDANLGFEFAHRTLYLPPGTYRLSGPLVFRQGAPAPGRRDVERSLSIIGAGSGSLLRLDDGARGFADPSVPRAVLATAADDVAGTDGHLHIADLAIDTGRGNAGAIGLMLWASRYNSVRRIAVRSADGAGVAGIAVRGSVWGAACVEATSVSGFAAGMVLPESGLYVTLHDCAFERQRHAAIDVIAGQVLIDGCRSDQPAGAVALRLAQDTYGCVLRSRFAGTADAAIVAAGGLRVQELATDGHRLAVADAGCGGGDLVGGAIAAASRPRDPAAASPSLASVPEWPSAPAPDLAGWTVAGVSARGSALAEVVAGGASHVMLSAAHPHHRDGVHAHVIGETIELGSSVVWLRGMHQAVMAGEGLRARGGPLLRITGEASDPPLVIEGLRVWDFRGDLPDLVTHASRRRVVFRDMKLDGYSGAPGAGPVAFVNVDGKQIDLASGQSAVGFHALLRPAPADDRPLVINRGADLWFVGLCSTGDHPLVETLDGCVTVLGGRLRRDTGDALRNHGAGTIAMSYARPVAGHLVSTPWRVIGPTLPMALQ